MTTEGLISYLEQGYTLGANDFAMLIRSSDDEAGLIREAARRMTDRVHGRRVLVRGLLQISNRCRNNCYYCGLRASNSRVSRYTMTRNEILDACRQAYAAGLRTFVLQGGEWPLNDADTESVVRLLSAEMPDSAITLSLGERPRAVYARWLKAGASRYLLRHETADSTHYNMLHPSQMRLATRIQCLNNLTELGYATGAGMMIGTPGQTVESLSSDLMLLQRLRPAMVGIGPFIPHPDTPFSSKQPGTMSLTTRLISIVRLLLPSANIPATTATASLHGTGRESALLAGANVVMPNITPAPYRGNFELYPGHAPAPGELVAELDRLAASVVSAGFELDFSRGD